MELFKIISGYFKRIIGVLLAISIIGSPITGWINKKKDNPVVSQKNYIDFTSDYIAELFYPKDDDGFIAEPTKTVARDFVRAVIIQLILGEDENGKVVEIAESIPHSDYPHNTETQWDQNALEKAIANALDSKKSSILPENIESMLRGFSEGVNDLHVYFGDTQYENVYEFRGSYLKDDGRCVTTGTGVFYNSETGVIYGRDNKGIYGIGFDVDVKHYVLITPTDAWQKKFGYNIGYDILGDILFMDCDTVRIKFNYKGTERMVQMWKGNYSTLSNGAEIGVYIKDQGKIFQYTGVTEDEQIPMSMTLSSDGKKILEYSSAKHWWLGGFKLGPNIKKSTMVLDFTMDFKDEEYATLFCEAAAKNGVTTQRNGSFVSGSWK